MKFRTIFPSPPSLLKNMDHQRDTQQRWNTLLSMHNFSINVWVPTSFDTISFYNNYWASNKDFLYFVRIYTFLTFKIALSTLALTEGCLKLRPRGLSLFPPYLGDEYTEPRNVQKETKRFLEKQNQARVIIYCSTVCMYVWMCDRTFVNFSTADMSFLYFPING